MEAHTNRGGAATNGPPHGSGGTSPSATPRGHYRLRPQFGHPPARHPRRDRPRSVRRGGPRRVRRRAADRRWALMAPRRSRPRRRASSSAAAGTCRYRVDGKQRWESAARSTRRAGRSRPADRRRARRVPGAIRITLHEYAREWVERYQGTGAAASARTPATNTGGCSTSTCSSTSRRGEAHRDHAAPRGASSSAGSASRRGPRRRRRTRTGGCRSRTRPSATTLARCARAWRPPCTRD